MKTGALDGDEKTRMLFQRTEPMRMLINCQENKFKFFFGATWGDSMAATLSQGANIIMITPMQKYVNKYFEQKQLHVFLSPNLYAQTSDFD